MLQETAPVYVVQHLNGGSLNRASISAQVPQKLLVMATCHEQGIAATYIYLYRHTCVLWIYE